MESAPQPPVTLLLMSSEQEYRYTLAKLQESALWEEHSAPRRLLSVSRDEARQKEYRFRMKAVWDEIAGRRRTAELYRV